MGRELERLGFTKEIALDALQSVLADSDERAVLDAVVASKLRGRRTIPDPSAYRRLFAALLRRGFPADLIRTALRPYWRHGAEPQPDVVASSKNPEARRTACIAAFGPNCWLLTVVS